MDSAAQGLNHKLETGYSIGQAWTKEHAWKEKAKNHKDDVFVASAVLLPPVFCLSQQQCERQGSDALCSADTVAQPGKSKEPVKSFCHHKCIWNHRLPFQNKTNSSLETDRVERHRRNCRSPSSGTSAGY